MRPVIVAAVLVLACKSARAPAAREIVPPSADEARAVATLVASALVPCSRAKLETLVDRELLVARAIAGQRIPAAVARQTRDGFLDPFCESLQSMTRADVVGVRLDAGSPTPVIRLLTGEERYEYLELVLDHHDGVVRVADFFFYTRGEHSSSAMGSVTQQLIADTKLLRSAEDVRAIQSHLVTGRYPEAYAIAQRLPPAVREIKQVQLLEVHVVGGLEDDAAYAEAIEHYAKRYPNDPALDVLQIDIAWVRERYDDVIAGVDRLDRRVGGDPYLDSLRASAHAYAGRHDEAVKLAKRATTALPELVDVWRTQLVAQVAAGHHRGALETLSTLQQQFGLLLDEPALRADPRYAALADTPAYATWKARATR
jgi:tetratricopeptide (TPR) repeat protein